MSITQHTQPSREHASEDSLKSAIKEMLIARFHAQQRRQEAEARQVQQGQGAGTPSQTQPGPPASGAAPLQVIHPRTRRHSLRIMQVHVWFNCCWILRCCCPVFGGSCRPPKLSRNAV